MTRDEVEEVEKCTKKVRDVREEKRHLEAEVLPRRKKMMEAPARPSTNPKKDSCPWQGNKCPDRLPDDEAPHCQPLAKMLLPPGAFVLGGDAMSGKAWGGHLNPHTGVTCSWHIWGGNKPAMMACVTELWRQFLADNHMQPSQCPIAGLKF